MKLSEPKKSLLDKSFQVKLGQLLMPFVRKDGKWHQYTIQMWIYGSKKKGEKEAEVMSD